MSLNQRAAAAQALHNIDYPFEAIAETMGATKTRIAELQSMRASSRLLTAIASAGAALDPDDLRKRLEVMNLLIEAGATPASARETAGLDDIEFGDPPVPAPAPAA